MASTASAAATGDTSSDTGVIRSKRLREKAEAQEEQQEASNKRTRSNSSAPSENSAAAAGKPEDATKPAGETVHDGLEKTRHRWRGENFVLVVVSG